MPFHKFAALVKDQVTKLQSRHAEVAFRVAVKDGKVNFTARGLKGGREVTGEVNDRRPEAPHAGAPGSVRGLS